jgi:hypothetical protein
LLCHVSTSLLTRRASLYPPAIHVHKSQSECPYSLSWWTPSWKEGPCSLWPCEEDAPVMPAVVLHLHLCAKTTTLWQPRSMRESCVGQGCVEVDYPFTLFGLFTQARSPFTLFGLFTMARRSHRKSYSPKKVCTYS